jgi:hypothetical protein
MRLAILGPRQPSPDVSLLTMQQSYDKTISQAATEKEENRNQWIEDPVIFLRFLL